MSKNCILLLLREYVWDLVRECHHKLQEAAGWRCRCCASDSACPPAASVRDIHTYKQHKLQRSGASKARRPPTTRPSFSATSMTLFAQHN